MCENCDNYVYRACVTLHKLSTLITHPLSQHETERHLQFLDKFLADTKYGFWMHNIPKLIPLFEALSKKVETIPDFHQPFQDLLRLSAIAPLQIKCSDQMTYFRDLQEYFSMLGYLVACLKDEQLCHLVLDALLALLDGDGPHYQCSLPLKILREAARTSRLPEITSDLSQVISNHFYAKLLKIMVFLTNALSAIQTMAEENTINSLLIRLDKSWQQRDQSQPLLNQPRKDSIVHFDDTCQIVWVLLDYAKKNGEKIKTPSLWALWSIEYALHWTMLSTARKNQRNNLMAIILKLLHTFPQLKFVESGLAETILSFIIDKHHCFEDDRLDVHFKKLIWACLYYYQSDEELELIKTYRIIEFLTQFIFRRPLDTEHCYECAFTIMALELLPKFATYAYADFLWLNGPALICRKIRLFINQPYDLDILYAFLYCLSEILFKKNAKIMNYIKVLGTLDIVVGIVEKILEVPQLKQIHQNCLIRAFCILNDLTEIEEYVHPSTLNLIIAYFNRLNCPKEDDAYQDVNTIICAVDFCWTALKISDSFFKQFHTRGGIYQLLDIVYKTSFPVQVGVLGVLADVCQKPVCVPYMITWRKNGNTILTLLLEIFRRQTEPPICEKRYSYAIKNNNFWINLCENHTTVLNFNMKQLALCGRLKIYSIISALKYRFKNYVEAANSEYKTYNQQLSKDEQLIMIFASNFPALHLCEAWLYLAKELINEGLKPIDEDRSFLCDKLLLIRNWQVYLQRIMEAIVKTERFEMVFDELDTYNLLKDGRLSDSLDALKEIRYLSNCTERMFHIRNKFRFSDEYDTISNNMSCERYHRALAGLTYSNVCNQCTSIESDVIVGEAKTLITEQFSDVENDSIDCPSTHDPLEDTIDLGC